MADTFTPSNSVQILNQGTAIKEGDTNTVFQVKLLDVTGQPVDLTNTTVTVYFSNQSNNLLLLTKSATNESDGVISFQFDENDATGNGVLQFQVNVTHQNGDIEKFPANDYAHILINPSLDNLHNVQLSTYTINQVIDSLTSGFTSSLNSLQNSVNTQISTFTNATTSQINNYYLTPWLGSINLNNMTIGDFKIPAMKVQLGTVTLG